MKVILQGRVLITNQQKHWFFSLNFDLCLRKLLLVKVFQYVSSCSWTFEETVRTGDIIANTWLIGHRQTHHLLCSTVHLFYSCKREKIGAINFKEIFSKRYTHHNDETQAWTCSARFIKKDASFTSTKWEESCTPFYGATSALSSQGSVLNVWTWFREWKIHNTITSCWIWKKP